MQFANFGKCATVIVRRLTAHVIHFIFVKTFASSQSANFDLLDVSFDTIKATSGPNGLFIPRD